MNKTSLRQLAINLLDDSHGISEDAYDNLQEVLGENHEDIFNAVEFDKGRYFLPENHGILADNSCTQPAWFMNDAAEGLFVGIVIGISICLVIGAAWFTPTWSWHGEAVKHNAAHYNQTTGDFEWNTNSIAKWAFSFQLD
jgi:hypothetical protein